MPVATHPIRAVPSAGMKKENPVKNRHAAMYGNVVRRSHRRPFVSMVRIPGMAKSLRGGLVHGEFVNTTTRLPVNDASPHRSKKCLLLSKASISENRRAVIRDYLILSVSLDAMRYVKSFLWHTFTPQNCCINITKNADCAARRFLGTENSLVALAQAVFGLSSYSSMRRTWMS